MWILLTGHLPVKYAPPRLSIFWSTPWPNEKFVKQQEKRYSNRYDLSDQPTNQWKNQPDVFYDMFGKDPNWAKARRIAYKEQDIRVFAHEFNQLTPENMALYVLGDDDVDPSHDLVSDSVASDMLVKGALDGESKPIYDAALMDGAEHGQALATALGHDITLPAADFMPLGWYRLKPGYQVLFP